MAPLCSIPRNAARLTTPLRPFFDPQNLGNLPSVRSQDSCARRSVPVRMTWPELIPAIEGEMKIQNLWIGAFSLALMLPFCNAQTANGASSISDLSTLIGTTHAITTTGPALTLDQVERTALARP